MDGLGGGDAGGGSGADSGGAAPATETATSAGPSSSGRVVGETPDTGDGGGAERKAEAAERKEAARLYKIKRGGEEREIDGDELAKRYSDDYEHEFTGPGGKPLKMKWDDVSRAVQLSTGAMTRVQRAAEAEKRLQEAREWGKQNPGAYIESQLGIEDHEEWAMQIAQQKYEREQELVELQSSNPSEALRRITDGIAKRMERKQQLEQHRMQQETRQREQSQQTQQAQAKAAEAFQSAGVPWSSETRAIASEIFNQYRQADVNLREAEVAKLVKRELHNRRRAELSALPPEELHSLLGADVITKLRAFDVQQLKGAKAAEKAAAPASSNGASRREEKQYTEAELRKMARGHLV